MGPKVTCDQSIFKNSKILVNLWTIMNSNNHPEDSDQTFEV